MLTKLIKTITVRRARYQLKRFYNAKVIRSPYIAAILIGDATANGTLTVYDAGPEVCLSGQDRKGISFEVTAQPGGRIQSHKAD